MKVLIVDDSANDRKLLRINLERHGCEQVIEARDGREGLELAREQRPDLIISDALMPRLDGFEFLRLVKTDEALNSIPFVFHSSVYTGEKDEELASRLGAETFISKPKDPEEFWREISTVLERLAAGRKKPSPSGPMAEETEFLREYSGVVAAKLEQKVRELEHALALMKEAEKKIVRAKNDWERTFDAVLDPIIILDTECRILRSNKAMAEMLGVTPSELIGAACYEKVHDMQEPIFSCPYIKLLKDGMAHTEELYEKTVDRYFSVSVYPMHDEEGKLTGSIHTMRDITERRNLEEQLRHAQKMEAIGTLAGGVAHDFNNILTAIVGFGSLLKMKMAKDDPLQVNVTQILAAADRAANLTRSMLTFSRKQRLEMKPASLNEIVLGMEKMLRRLIREDIELSIHMADGVLTVLADAGQIEQVLLNLTTNARDSLPDGGNITISTEQAELDKTFSETPYLGKPGRYALITFADNGKGMNESTRQRIFEPFFTTKEVGKGTGLGLSICYGIIKQHGGYIICNSEPGMGTTFRIYLPLNRPSAAEETAPAAASPKGGTEIILMAEDDAAVRNLTTRILAEFGYTVIEAQDGEEAVAKFLERPDEIQLCLFDLIMPKKNGREAYEEIRKVRPGLKVIFMSGYQPDVSKEGQLLMDESYIAKPLALQELLKRVRETLDR